MAFGDPATLVDENKINDFLLGNGKYNNYSLEQRRKIWNKWSVFRTKKKIIIDFDGPLWENFDFSELADAKGPWDFSYCDFKYRSTKWPKNMNNWKFEGSSLWNKEWNNVKLENVNFRFAHMSSISLKKADLTGADFTGATLGVDFRGAELMNAKFIKADLRHSHLDDADLLGTDFRGADLVLTTLSNAKFIGANFKNARYNATTIWPKGFDPKKSGCVVAKRSDYI